MRNWLMALFVILLGIGAVLNWSETHAINADIPMQSSILDNINDERRANGLAILQWSDYWGNLAQKHSDYMANIDVLKHSDCNCYENVYLGVRVSDAELPEYVVEVWGNSPKHKANMLNSDISTCGIGISKVGNKTYVTYMAD